MPDKPELYSEKKWDKPPSEEFIVAFKTNSAGCRFTRDHCGREHFCSDGGYDFHEDEMETLQELAEEYPDLVIDWMDVSVSTMHVGGQSLVIDCPCNVGRMYEDFMWSHRYGFAKYLSARAEVVFEKALEDAENGWGAARVARRLKKSGDNL